VPAELSAELSRGMDFAQFDLNEKDALVPAADAYVAALGLRKVTGSR
jgi:hypothetical protein